MSDWYEREPSLTEVLVTELQRLKRRARARLPLVLAIAVVLTAAIVVKVAKKPQQYRARVVLALTEGDMSSRNDSTPLSELRDYIGNVLLSNEKLRGLIKKHGDEYPLDDVRDMFDIAVWRNYFQYQQSFNDKRTARIAVIFTHRDPDFAYEMARELTTIIITAEGERRAVAARELAAQSAGALAAARKRVDDINSELSSLTVALTHAEERGTRGEGAVVRLRASEVALEASRAQEIYLAIEDALTMESLQAQVTAAGLALQLEVVDERKPQIPETSRTTTLIMLGVVTFMIFLPIVGITIGAFDTRVHDADDVARLTLPVLGHVPAFPGDQVGKLADRGVVPGRMKRLDRWR